eukprot:s393_g23.t1
MPKKTDLKGFKGFGFGGASTSKPGAGQAVARGKPQAKAAGGVAALFQESMDREEKEKKSTLPSWSKLTPEAAQAQKQAEAMMSEDPTVFQYDEILDDMKEELGVESAAEKIRADGLQQKKRVGLHVPDGADAVKTGIKRSAKYVDKVKIATDRRRVEQQIVEDRLLKKEKEARKDSEVFVTEAFKEELKRRKKFEEELEAQEEMDQKNAAEKQEHGAGFASIRGGEKVREMKPAREDLEEEAPKMEVKDEEDEKIKEELAPLVEKTEVKDEPSTDQPGVQDVAAAPKEEAKEKREEKALSAKERYLLRKKGLLAPEEYFGSKDTACKLCKKSRAPTRLAMPMLEGAQDKESHLQDFLRKHKFEDVNEPRVRAGCIAFGSEMLYPIHLAAQLGDALALQAIIEAGADLTKKTSKGRSPLDLAAKANRNGSHSSVLTTLGQGLKSVQV